MGTKDTTLEEAVIEFYRQEIHRRYQLDRMRQVEQFDDIPDAMLDALRDFFLERIYPSEEVRHELDAALDELRGLLHSPKRLTILLRSSLTSIFRLGAHMPAAISAAIGALDALRKTRKLETHMMEVAHRLDLVPKDAADRRKMVRVIAGVPEKVVRDLIHDVVHLFEALSDVKMLSGLLRVMKRWLRAMEARPDLYNAEERRGVALALEVLQGGLDLFLHLKPRDFPLIIKGIETIELAWFESVRREAKEE